MAPRRRPASSRPRAPRARTPPPTPPRTPRRRRARLGRGDSARTDLGQRCHCAIVELGQRVGGVEVYLGQAVGRDAPRFASRSIALTGNLHRAARAGAAPAFTRTADDAIAHALTDVRAAPTLQAFAGQRGEWTLYGSNGLDCPARARPVWFPLPDRLVPAWLTEVALRDGKQLRDYRHVIADDDGRVLLRGDLHRGRRRVPRVGEPDRFCARWRARSPTACPSRPARRTATRRRGAAGPGLGRGAQPRARRRRRSAARRPARPSSRRATTRRPTTTSTASITSPPATSCPTRPRPTRSTCTYDTSMHPQASSDQEKAAVTEMFYVTNWLHDFWYDCGFVERAGVAQDVELRARRRRRRSGPRRGPGLGRHRQREHGHAGRRRTRRSCRCTSSTRRRAAAPRRHDRQQVIEHEFGHYVHLRHGDLRAQQCFGMSEGYARLRRADQRPCAPATTCTAPTGWAST